VNQILALSISLESRVFGSTGKKTSYRNVVTRGKDYIILFTRFIAAFATGYWIIVDKPLDWNCTMTLSPWLPVTSVISPDLISASFIVIGITTNVINMMV